MKRIGLIVRWLNPVLTECVQLLRERGVDVLVIKPGEAGFGLDTLPDDCDLYALKSATAESFSLAGVLHRAGARIINPYETVAAIRDKFVATSVLRRGGVRVPETFMATSRDEVADHLREGAVVVKPHLGSRGEGVCMVREPADLAAIELNLPIMVQRYHPADDEGHDHKVFRIADELFGVRRRWPIRSYDDKFGEPFEVAGELAEMTLAAGDAFGIDLYGIDFVISDRKPYAVDMNKFGSYVGVPDAPRRLCDYLLAALG